MRRKRDYRSFNHTLVTIKLDLAYAISGLFLFPFSFKSNAFNTHIKRKSPISIQKSSFALSGERGIRTPGGVTLNSFQDCRIRPLCHFSWVPHQGISLNAGANIRPFFCFKNLFNAFLKVFLIFKKDTCLNTK